MRIDPAEHAFWLLSRGLGVVALALAALAVTAGLVLSSKVATAPGAPLRLKTFHESAALVALVAIVLHGVVLLGDGFLSPSITQIAVPFTLGYATFFTGLGIIAGWLALILGLSFYVRKRIGTKLWRWLHRWTLGVFVLGLVHAIGAGTDSGSAWFLLLAAAVTIPVAAAMSLRFVPGLADSVRELGRTRSRRTAAVRARPGRLHA